MGDANLNLSNGTKVDGRWKVSKKLGQGAFGAVYKVTDDTGEHPGIMAMKLESVKCKIQVLKLEVAVLKMATESSVRLKHACILYSRGRNDKYNFMVMTILGKELGDLRAKGPGGKLSLSTNLRIVFQCVKAIRDLHSLGWIHRDVKPANFAMGGNANERRRVFIFDFGLARRFASKEQGAMRKLRQTVGFRGTPRYCSVNVHNKLEQGRHDDLISILYMLVEFHHGKLPWTNIDDRVALAKMKGKLGVKIYADLPPTIVPVHKFLHSLNYDDQPKYSMFEEVLLKIIYAMGYNYHPLDWEGAITIKPTAKGLSTDAPSIAESIAEPKPKPKQKDEVAEGVGDDESKVEDLPVCKNTT